MKFKDVTLKGLYEEHLTVATRLARPRTREELEKRERCRLACLRHCLF